ncbi:hypothetical protein SBF1_50043 [Candidatus Desulfosporosinus infrequens]|uniref:Uncharacterized protein n=1 Tax=Candidatus Desulfosporosinus infrequens TaxID=2043169 RepID=A0A2U3LH67_9FIRM|nr:hypothetical protein SBF1_50043 [Candidatus Desulfosporosinus infrequens]
MKKIMFGSEADDVRSGIARWMEIEKKVHMLGNMIKHDYHNGYTLKFINEVFEEGFEMFESEEIEIFENGKMQDILKTRELSRQLSGKVDHTDWEKNRNKLYPNSDALNNRLPGSYGAKR